jgi:hypothetical protein
MEHESSKTPPLSRFLPFSPFLIKNSPSAIGNQQQFHALGRFFLMADDFLLLLDCN